ncbi:hypothetical protein KEM48_006350 [Puccinia striiformis f. sp. tritici PST-130]|nr:hypothetical protein Pst134EB_024737 [Puccinia striiformis f. sp. tritici]KAI9599821.1 hypothetical protein KEM48_006350 [Puccinia striiformis f. sp. tritici PST-130]
MVQDARLAVSRNKLLKVLVGRLPTYSIQVIIDIIVTVPLLILPPDHSSFTISVGDGTSDSLRHAKSSVLILVQILKQRLAPIYMPFIDQSRPRQDLKASLEQPKKNDQPVPISLIVYVYKNPHSPSQTSIIRLVLSSCKVCFNRHLVPVSLGRTTQNSESQSHRPSDLKLPFPPAERCESPEPFEDNHGQYFSYSLESPSPTYRIMFTPEFLISSFDSEENYPDGISESSAEDFISTQPRLIPLWSSAAEHIKPLVNRMVDAEKRKHEVVRLAWRPTSPQSSSASSDLDARTDALDTQPSSWVTCFSRPENRSIDSNDIAPLLRRAQSLPDIFSGSSSQNLSLVKKDWSNNSIYQEKDKQDEIKRWASNISFDPLTLS